MRRHLSQLRRPGLLAVAIAMVLTALTCAFVTPTVARAEDSGGFIYASYGNFYYTSAEDAIKASYDLNGATVVLRMDWNLDNAITIPEGKKVTLDMNGHTISSSKYAVFELSKGSQLTLTTNSETKDTQFTYRGYGGTNTDEHDYTVTSGGLVTSSSSSELTYPIFMHESSTLNLDGVAIAGSKAGNAGGVHMYQNTTLNMTNGATIQHNRGSGVHALEKNIHINMDNASISGNTLYGSGNKYGGGIDSGEEGFSLTMTNGSKIDGNCAYAGGGIYLNKSHFEITSPDNTGVISNNSCTASGRDATKTEQSGGGIHVDQRQFGDNEGFIEGLTICNNYSAYDGGGIEIDQEFVTIKNCVIKDNWCKYEGGGIYVCNDDTLIEGCTITGNACSVDSGGNYEGGGVFVWHSYDVALRGVCVIKGNTRGKGGSADDVFLRENAGATAKAYITGTLSKGSSVGVRSGITDDRRIAKNFKPESKDCLFYDLDGYYVSYGTDEGGDAWQRHTTKEFAAKIDGESQGKYRNGSSVTLVAPATKGGKVFWRWDENYTTGLYPVGDYLTEETAFKNALSFTMPQNEVDLVPTYVDRVKSAMFAVKAPEAGKALSTSGQLVRTDGGASASATAPCAVYWYEVKGGEKTLAAGVAKAGTTYEAYVSAPESVVRGVFYDESIGAGDVTVRMVSSSGQTKAEEKATDAYVTLSNSLAARTAAYTTDADAGKAAKTSTVKVQLKNKGLVGEGEAAVASLALDGDEDARAEGGLIGTVEVSYSYGDESDAVTISAPAQDGYNFCNWEVEGDALVSDEGTVTIPVSDLLKIESLTAAYTPVATSLEVKLAAPVAGKELAATCADITASCSDGEDVSLAAGFGAGPFEVTWSPEAEGEAAYSTAYTALIKITGEPGFEDVDKVLAKGATVTCGGVEAEAAGFTVVDGELCLAVSFPATRAVRPASVTQPEAVEVSFEQAAAGYWSLPKVVLVTLENGEVVDADVEWEAVEGFDANAAAAQELTAKGAITHIAYDGELDAEDLDRSVTVTVKVAAPQKQSSDDDTTTTTKTSKKGTPSTGDVTWGGFAGLLAVAVVCLAAARISLRKNR